MVVITGKAGVGKTTILNKIDKDVIHMDQVVKDIFYKRNFKLYWDIKEAFGPDYVGFRKVNTAKLGKLVFSQRDKLEKLNSLVLPYIKTYLEVLKQTNDKAIVEMAIYINHEDFFKSCFDSVVMIEREQRLGDKFKYLDKKHQPIKSKKIKSNVIIKDVNLDEAVESLNTYLKSINI